MTKIDLWIAVSSLQGRTYTTAKGLPFTITVKGNELFVSRKEKSITRATVDMAYQQVLKLQEAREVMDGPKKLGTFGASYLYPLFIALGVIEADLPPANKNNTTAEMSNITLSGTCTSPISDYNKDKKIREGEMHMPRGVKGSGKKALAADNTVSEPAIAKTRKPYPSIDERIALADQAIERLTKLNASRAGLIAQTEAKLAERKAALAKSEEQLEKVRAKKERLLAAKDRPAKEAAPKLTPEEQNARRQEALAKARAVKKAEKEKYDALLAALAQRGRTLDELLDELRYRQE